MVILYVDDLRKIIGLRTHTKKRPRIGGGYTYFMHLNELLENEYDFIRLNIRSGRRLRLSQGLFQYLKLVTLSAKADLFIRLKSSIGTTNFDLTSGKNLGLIHHVDDSFKNNTLLSKYLHKMMYRGVSKLDILITVSQYWKKHFDTYSANVKVIHNPFDFSKYRVEEKNIEAFKSKYNLTKKPIIYIGKCKEHKGVLDVYDKLKNLDVHIVTSGNKDIDIPAIHLNLPFGEYVCLLSSASVAVTMSTLKEGWSRITHEAMLCKTPVIGSGSGGMKELLLGGNQIVCENSDKLRDEVEYAMNSDNLGKKGYDYASHEKFSIPVFLDKWRKAINETIDG